MEQAAVLETPGDTVELRGRTSRVVAFFREDGDQIEVSLVVTAEAADGGVLRSGGPLTDGGTLAVRLSAFADGLAPDTVRVRREGARVHLAMEAQDLPVARAEPSRAGPTTAIAAID